MNIFIDAGFYAGNALKSYIDQGIVTDTWTIYAFEPNPELTTKERIKAHPFKIKLIKKAVWIKNGQVKFHISGREDAAGIANLAGHTNPKEIKVASLDFSQFVANLPEPAFIICSMDIEGAEYQVLEKMLADKTIQRIRILDVEFHHRLMDNYTEEQSQTLIDRLEAAGVEVKLKVALR